MEIFVQQEEILGASQWFEEKNNSTWEPHHGFSVIIDRIWELPVKVLMEVDEAQLQNLEPKPRSKEKNRRKTDEGGVDL